MTYKHLTPEKQAELLEQEALELETKLWLKKRDISKLERIAKTVPESDVAAQLRQASVEVRMLEEALQDVEEAVGNL